MDTGESIPKCTHKLRSGLWICGQVYALICLGIAGITNSARISNRGTKMLLCSL